MVIHLPQQRCSQQPMTDDKKPKEFTEAKLKTAAEKVQNVLTVLEMEIKIQETSEGLMLAGLARYIGLKIKQATVALGPEVTQRHINGFCQIISEHAKYTGDDNER